MKPGWAVIAAGLGLMLAAGAAEARGLKPPPEVVASAMAMTEIEEPPPGYIPIGPGMIRPVRITPGKAPDWLIDGEKAGMPSYLCGTGGCMMEIWTRGPNGHYRRVFAGQVREHSFHWIPGKAYTWMEVDFHGSQCGKTGVEACPWGFEWQNDGAGHSYFGPSLRFVRSSILRPVSVPQALDPLTEDDPSLIPAVIRQIIDHNIAACKAWGGSFSPEGTVNRLPDLNHDGIADWTYDAIDSTCDFKTPDTDSNGAPAPVPHADDDACTVLDCASRVWLSRREAVGGVTWHEAQKDTQRSYALRLTRKGFKTAVQLDNKPGVDPDSLETCTTYMLSQCVETPISLSPKP